MTETVVVGTSEYSSIHIWLRKNYGLADLCENPNCKGTSNHFDWSLLKGYPYERKRENFHRLCKPCHVKYDTKVDTNKKKAVAKLDKPISDEHKKQISETLRKRYGTYCAFGKCLSFAEWEEETGLNRSLICQRHKKYGWTLERALTTQPAQMPKKRLADFCRRSHAFTPKNTYWGAGYRSCIECRNINKQAWKMKQA